MSALPTWSDELEFHNDDVRRRTSADVDLGATWRWAGSNDAGRLSWIEQTGELYLCRADGYDGSGTDVSVLACVPDQATVEAVLDGWREFRTDPDGLSWLMGRTSLLTA